ncbi:hypothetical protein BW12_06920 [Bifidobacterium sp. UTCIF-3]|uniref:hypothetical protein n=1 Tax=unclassified Bifidobacterium TaxID=2608897 RepID=UPI0011284462|nr:MULTISPECIES: hypothetical protein [unclassified Bifidobacterium]TPF78380.1 hypothetical protein BW09_04825 [Bifidobacterium sp. UTCIF-1]TPF81200.1 hypothetical protein BW08_00755 [Bifidobacterium sp. UTCIF-24]TPF81980.1 hypothetical protein BW12_06920 [Bifidobacterium sp. UTCIF-3]TPF85172.1 hypothetical protein BW07_00430 [Bifidobacterium sp. UTCIF-36]
MAGYAKLSNQYWQDKDVLKLRRRNPAAALLHVLAISWCSDHTSDGRIDEDTLLFVLGATDQDVADLVASGMLQPAEDEPGMYVLRSYLKYQNSAEQIEKAKADAAERQRNKRERDKAAKSDDNRPVTGMSDDGNATVTDMSRRDNRPVTGMSFNQEPRTKNQIDFSNEKSLPQTPSRGPSESQDEEYPLAFEQFWVTYPRKEGKRKALAAWKRARRKTNNTLLVAKASLYQADPNRDPGYTLTPANWLDGEHWLDDPLPEKRRPGQPDPQAEKTARLRDVDWLCTHVDDPEAQDAALELPEKSQALARARYPDEWYRLWRRGMKRREQAKQREAKQEATP